MGGRPSRRWGVDLREDGVDLRAGGGQRQGTGRDRRILSASRGRSSRTGWPFRRNGIAVPARPGRSLAQKANSDGRQKATLTLRPAASHDPPATLRASKYHLSSPRVGAAVPCRPRAAACLRRVKRVFLRETCGLLAGIDGFLHVRGLFPRRRGEIRREVPPEPFRDQFHAPVVRMVVAAMRIGARADILHVDENIPPVRFPGYRLHGWRPIRRMDCRGWTTPSAPDEQQNFKRPRSQGARNAFSWIRRAHETRPPHPVVARKQTDKNGTSRLEAASYAPPRRRGNGDSRRECSLFLGDISVFCSLFQSKTQTILSFRVCRRFLIVPFRILSHGHENPVRSRAVQPSDGLGRGTSFDPPPPSSFPLPPPSPLLDNTWKSNPNADVWRGVPGMAVETYPSRSLLPRTTAAPKRGDGPDATA